MLTSQSRRVIWSEPRVRVWWLLAVLVLLMFSAFVADRLWSRYTENQLIQFGVAVPAKIATGENKMKDEPVSSSDRVMLEVNWPDHEEELAGVYLTSGGFVGRTITLHIEKSDHTRWTDRSEPTPLLDSLFVGLLALPILPALIVVAIVQMRRLENIWQHGLAGPAVIFDRRHSPIAPMSYAVRCSLQNHANKKLFTVFVPRAHHGLEKGELIWVIIPPKKGRPLAVLWMEASGSLPA